MNTLLRSAVLAGLLMLGACTSSTIPVTQLAQDVNLIAAGVANSLLAFKGDPAVPAGLLARLQADDALVQQAAQAVATATAKDVTGPETVQLIFAANALIQDASTIPALPVTVRATFAAISTLLPVIQAEVGLPVAATASPGAMTPEQARAVLRGRS